LSCPFQKPFRSLPADLDTSQKDYCNYSTWVCVCTATTRDLLKLKSPHNEQVDDSRTHGLVGLLRHFSMTVTSRGSATYKRAQASAPATVRARVQHLMDGSSLLSSETTLKKGPSGQRNIPALTIATRGAWYGPAVIDRLRDPLLLSS
jgi:hypothetical protein